MVVLDEKSLMIPPPPPYAEAGPISPPPFPSKPQAPPTLSTLPPHILLRIVYETFSSPHVQKQRKVLYWLTINLRLVNRSVYIACMHVLRSTYLPAYSSMIRSPYTSDPFPHASATDSKSPSPLLPTQSLQRETRILDLFIALKVREDVWADESELHLEREESFKDLFDLMQPRARLEDLVRHYGTREGVISVPSSSGLTPVASVPTTPTTPIHAKKVVSWKRETTSGWTGSSSRSAAPPLPFAALSASFSPRAVGLALTTRHSKRTLVEISRTREETLEVSAKKLVRELKGWLASNPDHGIR
ncbi:hypothetical protein L226DRAFT_352108 [Lentinus tigrinus ALCF2SS1-7]|uniref:Uncharacterized protein n=1 Tax=Lentinus tigrinus ALCF2SS1-6 TaxID=1328759 RepID=A0A5C2RRT9_9APHY|nr:hypothetical protein L227DRAFT_581163 [Lentinus tigrinus ALCF2SS1-6]RPD76832.1 hypothetical protein L226DRAFT_352108 [Lentinus tigrinus ALCF2SS1-7]